MRRNEMHKVTFSLVSNHFDEVREELTFRLELDDIFSGSYSHGNPGGDCFALLFKFRNPIEGFSHELRRLLLGDRAQGGLAFLGMEESFSPILRGNAFEICFCLLQFGGQFGSDRIADIPLGIVGNNLIIYKGIQGELFTKVFEKFSCRQRSNIRNATSTAERSRREVRIGVWWSSRSRVTCLRRSFPPSKRIS